MSKPDIQVGAVLRDNDATEVRRATLGDGRAVVLKRAKSQDRATARLRREAAVTATLDHPNIRGLVTRDQDAEFVLLEAVEGVTLLDILQAHDRPLPIDAAVYVVEELLAALDYVHQQTQYIHRDITPANILIAWDGSIKLADFETAKKLGSAPTAEKLTRGTPCYMSPEQLNGGHTDERGDLFAVGVILYEMLTGTKPYGEAHPELLVRLFGSQALTTPRERRKVVPTWLDAVTARLLARLPDERFASAYAVLETMRRTPQGRAHFLTWLDVLRADEPTPTDDTAQAIIQTHRSEQTPEPPSRRATQRRFPWLDVVVAVLTLFVLLGTQPEGDTATASSTSHDSDASATSRARTADAESDMPTLSDIAATTNDETQRAPSMHATSEIPESTIQVTQSITQQHARPDRTVALPTPPDESELDPDIPEITPSNGASLGTDSQQGGTFRPPSDELGLTLHPLSLETEHADVHKTPKALPTPRAP